MAEKMSPIAVLRNFFEFKENQKLAEFAQEVKALSPAEKNELVTLAAKELGVEVEEK